MSGESIAFSAGDLDAICASYDPAVHEAPIVIGHPKDNAPAFGWIKSLARNGSAIEAEPKQVEPSFAEAVKAGRYKKVSASFYKPDSPANPKPGTYYLRHVGFLGAMPPAVKGLRDVAFSSGDDCVTIELGEGDAPASAPPDSKKLLETLVAWIGKKFGKDAAAEAEAELGAAPPATAPAEGETQPKQPAAAAPAQPNAGTVDNADPPAPGFDAKAIGDALGKALDGLLPAGTSTDKADALKQAIADLLSKFAAPAAAPAAPAPAAQTQATVDNAEKSPRELELEKREQDVAKRESAARVAEFGSFLDALLRQGKPLPEQKGTLVTLMTALDGSRDVSFGENDKRRPLDVFRDILRRLPKEIVFAELVDTELAPQDSEAMARAAVAYQEEQGRKGIFITTSEAVRHVSGKGI